MTVRKPIAPHLVESLMRSLDQARTLLARHIAPEFERAFVKHSEEDEALTSEEEIEFAAQIVLVIDQLDSVAQYLLHRNDVDKEDWE